MSRKASLFSPFIYQPSSFYEQGSLLCTLNCSYQDLAVSGLLKEWTCSMWMLYILSTLDSTKFYTSMIWWLLSSVPDAFQSWDAVPKEMRKGLRQWNNDMPNLERNILMRSSQPNVNNLSITRQKCRHTLPYLAVIKISVLADLLLNGDYKLFQNPYHLSSQWH